ncbi:MAG: signal peptidase I [Gracilibacteraceae bacterium]|jgi:signal peptidase I|nr:signal peptidase I [Gracilibacteraceae bacterium]
MRNRTIVFLLLAVTAVTQLLLLVCPDHLTASIFEGFRPLIYGLMFIFCFVLDRKDERTHSLKADYLLTACLGALLYVIALFVSGLILGFANNPMDTGRLKTIVSNSYSYLGVAMIREYVRGKVMTLASGKSRYIIMVLITATLVFTFSGMDNIKSIVAYDAAGLLDYVFTILLPMLILNGFLCYTARRGGMIGNMIFQFVYWAVYLYSPFMPNIQKIMEAIFIQAVVLIMFVLFNGQEWRQHLIETKQAVKSTRDWLWMTPAGIVLALCQLFGLGVFPFIPVGVASNSMKGEFSRGDMVIIEKITEETLGSIQVGDIIQYRYGKISVVHRVVEVRTTVVGGIEYVMKGDYNPVEDIHPVKPNQVLGFARWHIPYLGFPAMLISSLTPTPGETGDIQTPD